MQKILAVWFLIGLAGMPSQAAGLRQVASASIKGAGHSNVLNQLNYGQPTARAGQVFGSGGLRAFQFAARSAF
jgi:hypothetical protein